MRLKILFWFLKEEFLEKILIFKKILSSSVRFENKSQDGQYLSLTRKKESKDTRKQRRRRSKQREKERELRYPRLRGVLS